VHARCAFALCALLSLPAPASAQGDSPLLVWTRTGNRYRTLRFDGRHARAQPGIRIGTTNGVVDLAIESVPIEAWQCNWEAPDDQPMEQRDPRRRLFARRLVAVRGAARTVLLDVGETDMLADLQDRILVRASLGPFVCVERRRSYVGNCSSHGDWAQTFHWFDLRDARPAPISAASSVDLSRTDAELRQRFRRAVILSDEDPNDYPNDDPIEIIGTSVFYRNGRWRSQVHVLLFVPYAWTDGETSYAIDSAIGTHELDPMLRLYSDVPAPVRAYLAARPNVQLGGISQ
jgi:hypothetical protein